MEQVQVGQLLVGKHERDAIHIAVAPVVAKTKLEPGQHIGFVSRTNRDLVGVVTKPIGVVDPYLTQSVKPGQQFFIFLYPQTVTALRHHWSHPAFADAKPALSSEKSQAEEWLRDHADIFHMSLQDLLDAAFAYQYSGDSYCLDFSTPEKAYDDCKAFWENYEIYTGETVSPDSKDNFFRCAC